MTIAYGFIEGDAFIVAANLAVLPMAGYIARAASRSHHEHEPHGTREPR